MRKNAAGRRPAGASAKDPGASAKSKMQRYRERLRAAGLRPLQIWVPDTRAPGFRRKLQAQSRRAARHPSENEAQAFLDAAFLDLQDE